LKEIGMTETVKKAKAPAKPRKTAAKKETIAEVVKTTTPSREEIAELARKYWAERGWQDGYAEQDWLRAEQELRGMAS
jgi:flagellar biosynthesis/type III secretory pathway protein FliH